MSIEDTFAKFQKNFEEVTLTLIAAMSKITENLDRVTSAMDLAAKIEIQNIENKQVLQNLEKQIKAVLNRLDKMSRGGFEIPEAPLQPVATSSSGMDDIFNATIDKPSQPVDDLEAEFGPLDESALNSVATTDLPKESVPEPPLEFDTSPAPKLPPTPTPAPPAPKLPPTPTPAPPAPKLPPTQAPAPPAPKLPPTPAPAPLAPKTPETDEIPVFEEEIHAPTPKTPSISNLSPLPPPPSQILKPKPQVPSGDIHSPPQPPAPHIEPEPTQGWDRKFPVSNWSMIESPTSGADILNNLMLEIEDAESLEEVGRKILATKDSLSKKVPFSPAYFEMLMLAGPYANSKGKPNSMDVVKKCFEKIQTWRAVFR